MRIFPSVDCPARVFRLMPLPGLSTASFEVPGGLFHLRFLMASMTQNPPLLKPRNLSGRC